MHLVVTFGFKISTKFNVSSNQLAGRKKIKARKMNRKNKKNRNQDKSETTHSPNIINVGDVLADIHVEYEFLPSYTFKFDCRCWETATKIYTENGDWSIRPILCPIENDIIWIVFSVHHLVKLNEIQLQYFFNHVITYRIFYGNKRFSERAKKDKVNKFYIRDSSMDIGPHDFLEIYPAELYNANFDKKSSTSFLPESIIVTNEVYGDFSITTYLNMIPDKAHEYKFRKMLRKNRFPPECSEIELLQIAEKSMPETNIKSVTKKRLKANKLGKRKQDTEVTYEINLPAETMFSGMGTIASYKRTQSSNVSAISIHTECRDILPNKRLRKNFNPIAIKLEQLSNFPSDLIIENGFKYLYMKVFFLNHTIVTPYCIPNSTMCFELVKCFLCKEFNPEELISFLITKPVIVKIIGVRIVNVIQPVISVPKKSAKEGSEKPLKTVEITTKEEVLLGVAKFDLSDLLRGLWEMRLISSLFHPRNIDFTCMDINDEKMNDTWKNSPLTNDILTSFGTSVKIKVRLSYNLRKMQEKILRCKHILNRIFLILNDVKLVNDILENVTSHNSSLLKTYQSLNYDDEDSMEQDIPKDILTGFVINFCEKFYIFLEGLSNGHLLTIWKIVANLPFQNKCVYYNSSYIFLTRLYEDFIFFGGVVRIELSDPLETELRKCSLYVGKTKTTVQAIVMKKLGLMKFTSTIESLCQACLFPESSAVNAFVDSILTTINNKSISETSIYT